jgi:MFS family permease
MQNAECRMQNEYPKAQRTFRASVTHSAFCILHSALDWRWVHVAVAALAMVATLPGRTQGLGLFTEPIRNSLGLDTESYGFLNMGATLLGALFCLPCGWLIDRLGTRSVLTSIMVALGGVVIVMSQVRGDWLWHWRLPWPGGDLTGVLMVDLFVLVLLTRGLGQSALSVASLSLIGRTATRRMGWAMGVYALLTSAGFVVAFLVLRQVVLPNLHEWRPAWAGIGVAVIVAGVLSGLLVRNRLLAASAGEGSTESATEPSRTLGQALYTPAFWTFGVAVSFYGMVAAGTSLFNEGILQSVFPQGTDEEGIKRIFFNVQLVGVPIGLLTNLLGGWLAARWSFSGMLALAMAALAAALGVVPFIRTEAQVYLYAAVMAGAGGVIWVCFSTVWRVGYGPAHLGKIQGAAQMLTVLFSALGPALFGSVRARVGSYLPLFPYLAAVSLGLALCAWWAGLPGERSNAKTI